MSDSSDDAGYGWEFSLRGLTFYDFFEIVEYPCGGEVTISASARVCCAHWLHFLGVWALIGGVFPGFAGEISLATGSFSFSFGMAETPHGSLTVWVRGFL